MSDEIERALARALALDPRIWSTPDRLRAVLMDLCPAKQAQRRVLVAVAEEGIVAALSSLATGVWSTPFPPQARSLSLRLQARTGIDPSFADWAVRQWSIALGLSSGLKLREPPAIAPIPSAGATASPPRKAARATGDPASVAVVRSPSPLTAASPRLASGKVLLHSKTPSVQRILGVTLALALPLLGGGLYMRTRLHFRSFAPPVPVETVTVVPATWWIDPGSVQRLETTFVGTREHLGGNREALFLQIRSLHIQRGRGFFEYTLNVQGLRFNNLGTLQKGKLSIPDLGTAEVLHEAGHLLLRGSGPSPQGNWELRATTP